jgi:hypothetical protein
MDQVAMPSKILKFVARIKLLPLLNKQKQSPIKMEVGMNQTLIRRVVQGLFPTTNRCPSNLIDALSTRILKV